MSVSYNPGDFQKRIVRLVNYEDGLWDITLGLFFLALGVFPLTRQLFGPTINFTLYLAFLAIVVIVQQYARRVIAAPRIGVVKRLWSKPKLIILTVLILLLLLTLVLVVVTLTSSQSPQPSYEAATQARTNYTVDIIVGVAIIGIFSLLGFVFGIRRLHLYGVLLGVGNLASTILSHNNGYPLNVPLLIAAGIIILIGCVLLRRFLRKYPILSDEAMNAER